MCWQMPDVTHSSTSETGTPLAPSGTAERFIIIINNNYSIIIINTNYNNNTALMSVMLMCQFDAEQYKNNCLVNIASGRSLRLIL